MNKAFTFKDFIKMLILGFSAFAVYVAVMATPVIWHVYIVRDDYGHTHGDYTPADFDHIMKPAEEEMHQRVETLKSQKVEKRSTKSNGVVFL